MSHLAEARTVLKADRHSSTPWSRPSLHSEHPSSFMAMLRNRRFELSVIGLAFLGIGFYGADSAGASLLMVVLWSSLLLLALRRTSLRPTLAQSSLLASVAVLFCGLIGYATLSLTPWFPGHVHPAWAWVQDRAGTLDRSSTMLEIVRLIGLATAFLVGLLLGQRDDRATRLVDGLGTACLIYALAALGQQLMFPGQTLGKPNLLFPGRLTASFFSPNVAAGFFGAMLLLLWPRVEFTALLNTRWRKAERGQTRRLGAIVLSCACLMMTASRLGFLAVLIVLPLSFIAQRLVRGPSTGGGSAKVPIVAGLGLFTLFGLASPLLFARLGTMDPGWNGRQALFGEHWKALQLEPLFGHGLGSFTTINKLIISPPAFEALWYIRSVHNVYLQWLEETGLVGATMMFLIIALLLLDIALGLFRRQRQRDLLVGVLGFSGVLLVQGLGDFSLQTPGIAIFWSLLLGLGVAVARSSQRGGDTRTVRARIPPFVKPVAFGVGSLSLVASVGLLFGGLPIAMAMGWPLSLRPAYHAAAEAQLIQPTKGAEQRTLAQTALRRALQQSPVDAYAWAILADIDDGEADRIEALNRSYESSPLDPSLFRWRTAIAARLWPALPPGLRQRILADVEVERERPGVAPWLHALQASYPGTSFALAVAFVLDAPQN